MLKRGGKENIGDVHCFTRCVFHKEMEWDSRERKEERISYSKSLTMSNISILIIFLLAYILTASGGNEILLNEMIATYADFVVGFLRWLLLMGLGLRLSVFWRGKFLDLQPWQGASALGKRPLSTTSFSHAYDSRGGKPPPTD
nr:hypothetical protein [Tanacetum cinerariifolium]